MIFFKKKVKSVLNEQDVIELRELERKAYLDKARELIKLRGEENARKDLEVKRRNDF